MKTTDPYLAKHIRGLVLPIFEKSLQEVPKNHMVVGSGRSNDVSFTFVQPHNYRSYFQYSRVSGLLADLDSDSGFIKTEGRSEGGGSVRGGSVVPQSFFYKKCNHMKEISFPDFLGCRVVVKKNTIEILNKIDYKRWFSIRLKPDLVEDDMLAVVRVKESQSLDVLQKFLFYFGGSSDCVLLRSLCESKVKGESGINSIPMDMHFHNQVGKTVYVEKNDPVKNFEFKSMALASQYIETRCKEDFLTSKFEELRKDIMSAKPSLSPLEAVKFDVVCFPDDVFACADSIIALSDGDKACLTDWFFEQFGGMV